jgi:hypothetical protein
MGCCGNNRAAFRVASAAPASAGVAGGAGHAKEVRLRWRRRVTAVVDGPVTRTRYPVSAETPLVTVDPRDAVGLLRTGFFERIG